MTALGQANPATTLMLLLLDLAIVLSQVGTEAPADQLLIGAESHTVPVHECH